MTNHTHDTTNNSTQTTDVSAQPPRWAVWAAYAVPLCLLPSCAWRVSLVTTDLANVWYPVLLSVLEMSAALLTLGLVQSWGEVVPRWIPRLGGRRIPIRPVVILATLGAIVVFGLFIYGILNDIFNWVTPEMARAASPVQLTGDPNRTGMVDPTGNQAGVGIWVKVLYAPSLAWGPLLFAVTVAYYRRRTQAPRPAGKTNHRSNGPR